MNPWYIGYIIPLFDILPQLLGSFNIGYTFVKPRINRIHDARHYHRIHHLPCPCLIWKNFMYTLWFCNWSINNPNLFLDFKDVNHVLPQIIISSIKFNYRYDGSMLIWRMKKIRRLVCHDKGLIFVVIRHDQITGFLLWYHEIKQESRIGKQSLYSWILFIAAWPLFKYKWYDNKN